MRRAELLATSLAATTCAGVGGLGTKPDSLYYRTLRKPRWQPPGLAFPLVWTALYADIAVTTGQALSDLNPTLTDGRSPAPGDRRNSEYRAIAAALGVNLVLNTGWCWLFFTWHRRRLAVLECAVLTLSSADLVRRVGAVNKRAGWALAPYPVWCAFATVLSAAIARLNPTR